MIRWGAADPRGRARFPGAAALLLALGFGPAMAGTYDVLEVNDDVIGISPDHIVILRQARDNMASYFSDMTSKAVILIDRDTGTETILPLSRAYTYEQPDGKTPPVTEQMMPPNSQADLMAQSGARPIDRATDATSPPDAARPSADAIAASVNATLTKFTREMDYQRNGPVPFSHILETGGFEGADCTIGDITGLAMSAEDPPTSVATVICDQPDAHSAKVIRVLPARP